MSYNIDREEGGYIQAASEAGGGGEFSLQPNRHTVYEFSLSDMQRIDQRFGNIEECFFRSCTRPAEGAELPLHNAVLYDRANNGLPKRIVDSFNEFFSKINSAFLRFFSSRVNRAAQGSPWVARNGKFTRTANGGVVDEGVVTASRELGEILGEQLDNANIRGNFYYPNGGYREWHTNQFDPHGWRLYFVHTNGGPDCAYFHYIDPVTNERITKSDRDGCMRLFYVGNGRNTLWHAVTSNGDRWSLGFILSDRSAGRLIQLNSLLPSVDP